MAETTYTSVTWTAGDTITEAKLDNMVANDRAVNAMYNGVRLTERSDPADGDVGANNFFLYAKDSGGVSTLYAKDDGNTVFKLSELRPSFVFTVIGTLTTGTSVTPILVAHRALTIVKAYANVKTAPTDDDLILDINKNGSTIWSTQANRVTVSDAATSGTQTSFNTTALAEGDILTLDIDQVGSTVAGADLTVTLRCKI